MSYQHYLSFAVGMMHDMQEKNEQKLEEIQDEWVRSMDYPRKKKKRVRKRLLIDWSIFSWAKETYGY